MGKGEMMVRQTGRPLCLVHFFFQCIINIKIMPQNTIHFVSSFACIVVAHACTRVTGYRLLQGCPLRYSVSDTVEGRADGARTHSGVVGGEMRCLPRAQFAQ